MKNLKIALIGKDVSKSVSPQIHNFIARSLGAAVRYDKVSLTAEEFEDKIGGLLQEYDGLNLTIPYKLQIIPRLKRLVGDAEAFGAVNTVDCRSLSGYNTDGQGFMLMLKNGGVEVAGKRFLILGGGGAGRSCAKSLADGGAQVGVYDVHPERREEVAKLSSDIFPLESPSGGYYAAINATGVGMHNTVGQSPVGGETLETCEVAIDLIYNPAQSEFLRIAKTYGKKTLNGLAMLFYQAYFAQCVWLNLPPDCGAAKSLFEKFLKEESL